jgi:uncharacterized protein DUF4352
VKRFFLVFGALLAVPLMIACGGDGGTPATGGGAAANSPVASKAYTVGTAMVSSGKSVTVLTFKANFSTGNEYDTPKAGNEYVQVTYGLLNGSKAEWSNPLFELTLIDANGQKYNSAFVTAGASADIASLVAGGKAPSVTQVYEVPASSILDVAWTPNMFESTVLQTPLK